MTHTEIRSFLAICRCKTVTRAAELLYVSQSALSTRLRTLEKSLGGTLFYRQKGSREMILTPKGKAFFNLAVQYESIVLQMEQLCQSHPLSLRVASLNSLGSFLLPAVYETFLQEHPEAELEIQEYELAPACRSIQRGLTDLAFTAGTENLPGIKSMPIFSEPMVLICSETTKIAKPVSPKSLPLRSEVYVPWCKSFVRWHQEVFDLGVQPRLSISGMEQLRIFMKRQESWAIVPESVAAGLERTTCILRCETAVPLPRRDIYCILPENPMDDAAISMFLACLRKVLEQQSCITVHF